MWLICTGAIDGAEFLRGSWLNVYEAAGFSCVLRWQSAVVPSPASIVLYYWHWYTAETPSAAEQREKTQHSSSCPSPDLRRYVMRPLTRKCATQSFVAHNYLFSYYSALTELIPLLLWRTLQPAENVDRLHSWKKRHQRAGSVCLSWTL